MGASETVDYTQYRECLALPVSHITGGVDYLTA